MPIGLILEAMVALLLAVTVVYCFLLDRRLRQLRSGQDGLRDLIKALNEATDRAQSGIAQLKISADASGQSLKAGLVEARSLADELALMTETGNNIADRLEGSVSVATRNRRTMEAVAGRSDNLNEGLTGENDDRSKLAVDERLLNALREAR